MSWEWTNRNAANRHLEPLGKRTFFLGGGDNVFPFLRRIPYFSFHCHLVSDTRVSLKIVGDRQGDFGEEAATVSLQLLLQGGKLHYQTP